MTQLKKETCQSTCNGPKCSNIDFKSKFSIQFRIHFHPQNLKSERKDLNRDLIGVTSKNSEKMNVAPNLCFLS